MGRRCSRYVVEISLELKKTRSRRQHTKTDRKTQEEFHGLMHFPTDNLPSFLEVSEEPDPQNLSPAALQCYCKFKKPKIETTPASSFNNQGDEGEDSSFIEEKSTTKKDNIEDDGRIGLLEENEHQSLRRSRTKREETANKYEDSAFMDRFDSYEKMFTDEKKDVGLW